MAVKATQKATPKKGVVTIDTLGACQAVVWPSMGHNGCGPLHSAGTVKSHGVGRIELIQESIHGIFIVPNALCRGHWGGWLLHLSFWAAGRVWRQLALCDHLLNDCVPSIWLL